MDNGVIERATRIIGLDQGYLGLTIRDEVIFCEVAKTLVPTMTTAWYPSPEELKALNEGKPVYVILQGWHHPPIRVTVAEERHAANDPT